MPPPLMPPASLASNLSLSDLTSRATHRMADSAMNIPATIVADENTLSFDVKKAVQPNIKLKSIEK